MIDTFINILSPRTLKSKEEGKQILHLLTNSAWKVAPDYYGNDEPIRNRFEPSQPEEALRLWRYSFLWKRKRPHIQGSVWMDIVERRERRKHGIMSVSTESASLDENAMVTFVQDAAKLLTADFAFTHLLTPPDVEKWRFTETVFPLDLEKRTKFHLMVTTFDLRKYLPDLYWGTIFGAPYVRLFGRSRILSAPAYQVRELSQGMIYVQLSESLSDLRTNYEGVEAVRRGVKQHLDSNAFFDPSKGEEHEYNIPQFAFAG